MKIISILLSVLFFNLHASQDEFAAALNNIFEDHKVVFVPIVSYEGDLCDPLCFLIKQHGWTCILTDPVPHLFHEVNCGWYKRKDPLPADQIAAIEPIKVSVKEPCPIEFLQDSEEALHFDAEGDETCLTVTVDYSIFNF